MEPIPLHYVWQYTDVDRAFWHEHLEDWLPRRLIDAHVHISHPAHRLEPMTDQRRRQYWVAEVNDPMDAPAADHCDSLTLPDRQVAHVAMGMPDLDLDTDKGNDYVRTECVTRGLHALAVLLPQWTVQRVTRELAQPGVIGLKPYYSLISHDPATRDKHIEASIFAFVPHPVLELLNDRRAWLTLHVPKADRLPHPDNIREIKEIRRRYPDIVLVIAHLGRCYTEAHAREGLPPLADDPGLNFDNSAVLNPAVHRIALETLGPERLLWGTDNPVFYMHGRRQWQGRTYTNRTDYPFHFNTDHEPPEVEAGYTLYMYEALRAIRDTCDELGVGREQVEAMFYGNAERLIRSVLDAKHARGE